MTRRPLALAAGIGLLAASVGVGPALGSSATKRVAFTAHFASPPDKFNTLPPCDPATGKSPTGICRGTATGFARLTGSFQGRADFEYGWFTAPSGITYVQGVETFTGTVPGCGTGTITYRISLAITSIGKLTGTMSVIRELGTGSLKGSSGSGAYRGTVKADYSNTGVIRGHITCGH